MSPLPLHSCPRPPWTNRAHPSSPTRGHPAWQSLHVEETKCPAPCSSDIQDWFCIERRAGINLFPFLSSGLSGSPPTSSRLIHLEISPATLGANRRDRSQPSARRRLWVSPAPHQEAQGQAPLPAPPSIIPRTRAPSPMQGPDQLGAAHRLPAPSLRIHMETEGWAGHTKTGASFVLHTQRPQNKAPCLSCHAELPAASQAAGVCCLPTAGAHTRCEKQTEMQRSCSAKIQIVHRWFRLQSGAGLDIIKSPYSSGSPVTACVIYRAQQLFQQAD